MEIRQLKISDIQPNDGQIEGLPTNPRFIKDDKFKKLVESLQNLPSLTDARPVIVYPLDGKFIAIGGNMRVRAAKELKWKTINCAILENGTTAEVLREIAIKDNVGYGENDWELLSNDWDAAELEAWGMDLPSFDTEVLEAVEDDYTEPDNMQVDVVLGDLIEIGQHRLLCGDSTDSDAVAKLMGGELADMVFTDPPYGVSYEGGHNKKKRVGIENDTLQGKDLTNLFRDSLLNADLFSKDYSAFYIWFSTNKAQETFLSFSELNLDVRAILCWYKVKSGLGAFMAQYIPNFEPCIYAFKKGKTPQWFGASDEKSVWELKKDQRNDYHPTQKPIELPERAIKNSSKLSDIVLDVFLGSGSTMVAAHQLNRKCYGMELDPKYCQVVIDRMQKLDPNLTVKINGQPYKKEVPF